jgi:hypothetical protein
MAHDAHRTADLTFSEWATAIAASGRLLRIDLKEARALPSVLATMKRLGVAPERVSFNVSPYAPGRAANMSIDAIRQLRARFPTSWITLNNPLPFWPGHDLTVHAAHLVGGKVGMALMAPRISEKLVRRLTSAGVTVNVWNHPPLWAPVDTAKEAARLRSMGVNGYIDLRRKDDPLASD